MKPCRSTLSGSLLALIAMLAAACDGGGGGSDPNTTRARDERAASVRLEAVASGLAFPLDFAAPPGDPSRQFIAEKGGRVRVLRDGVVLDQPFLDLSGRVSGGSEQGLLGIAFHPGYPSDPRFFVNYTDVAGDTHVAGFRVSGNPDVAAPGGSDLTLAVGPRPNLLRSMSKSRVSSGTSAESTEIGKGKSEGSSITP